MCVCALSADASTYAHYLFNAFDSTQSGSIKFEVTFLSIHSLFFTHFVILLIFSFLCQQGFLIASLMINHSSWPIVSLSLCQDFVTALSILLRGTTTEKLQWTFNLYDINRDGLINKEVCLIVYFYCILLIFQSHLQYIMRITSGTQNMLKANFFGFVLNERCL